MIRLDDIPARGQLQARKRRSITIRGRLAAVRYDERNGLHMVTLDVVPSDGAAEVIRCHRGFRAAAAEAASGFSARMSAMVSCIVEVEGEYWWSGASGTYLLGCTRADLAAHVDQRRAA